MFQALNGNSGIQSSSIISPHSFGDNKVPLYYVVWENDNQDANGDFPIFFDKMISCATLKRYYYESGCHTAHQALMSFTTGHTL